MAQRVGRGIALLFHDYGTRKGEWSAARPGRTLPPVKTRYPLYRRLGGGARAGLDGRKISPHRGSIAGPSSLYSVAIPTELPGHIRDIVLKAQQHVITILLIGSIVYGIFNYLRKGTSLCLVHVAFISLVSQ